MPSPNNTAQKKEPQPIRLADYQAPAFRIETIDLRFELDEHQTLVTAALALRRSPGSGKKESLVLDGQNLDLQAISIDGKPLSDKDYIVTPDTLALENPPDRFVLETTVRIEPHNNTALEGLYKSSGNFVTQCEAEGFRKITYMLDRPDVLAVYSTEIIADAAKYPVLLSNGNLIEAEELPAGRRRVKWQDPHPKPSYLFALVAGNLACVEDKFTTRSGREVTLRIFVEHGKEDRCGYAMDALKRSMKWDEDVFGLEYDLDIFMIVAVSDFNMGAMENKGLNVFNDKYVLARPDTATDADYANIESIIAHEYFHNWTGNRVTCRDWFQLSLKEGLTVFRDQEFSADQRSRAVRRIGDVRMLRARQFPEDAGPLAHPVQPKSYIEINNFYTATVYEKGAELVRMIHTLIGAENFRKGIDLYFERHDGTAATVDDFVGAMADASGTDLSRFRPWYDQAGTPRIDIKDHYDAKTKSYELTLTQSHAPSPGQSTKQPVLMPVTVSLIGPDGSSLAAAVGGETSTEHVLRFEQAAQTFAFTNVEKKPTPSVLRGFSAPVLTEPTHEKLAFLMAHDTDLFNRWEASQQFATSVLLRRMEDIREGKTPRSADAFVSALGPSLTDTALDKAFLAQMLMLPSEDYVANQMAEIDVEAIHAARETLKDEIAVRYANEFQRLYHDYTSNAVYSPDAEQAGRRSLRNAALVYLSAPKTDEAIGLCAAQFKNADNMTDTMAALGILASMDTPARDEALQTFYDKWKNDNIVIDKWLSLQAMSALPDTLTRVQTLMAHESFTMRNPNKVRALVGAFCNGNQLRFHAADGAGYEFLADRVLELDGMNPQVAARLLGPLGAWRKFDTGRQGKMTAQLKRILDSQTSLSPDVYEIAAKSLA